MVNTHNIAVSNKPKTKRNHRPAFDMSELMVKPILTRYEFAFLIGTSVRLVDGALGNLIPCFKLGGRILIDREQALAALKRATGRGSEPDQKLTLRAQRKG